MKLINQLQEKQEKIKHLKKDIYDICEKIAKIIETEIKNQSTNNYSTYIVKHTTGYYFTISLQLPNKSDPTNLKSINKSIKKLKFHIFGVNEDLKTIIEICRKTLNNL